MTRSLRILTANLYSGSADPEALVELIERLRVDVVCAQELGSKQARVLSALMPESGFDENPDRCNRGLGIFCRHRVQVERFKLVQRDGWVARLSPEDWDQLREPVEVVNVHIMAPHMWPYFPRRATRGRQLEQLLAFLDQRPRLPRAVAGDLNSTPTWPVYRRLVAGHTDAAAEASPNGKPPATWPNLPALGIRGLIRIDHCFLSGLSAVKSRVVPVSGSDHLGLCVDVE